MSTPPTTRIHIALDTRALTDAERLALAAAIAKLAPQSPLITVPEIASGVTALGKKAAALKTSVDVVAQDEKQLKADCGTRNACRATLDAELVSLKGLVARDAKSPEDVTSIGYTLLVPAASRTRPDAPVVIEKPYKAKRGKTRVAVAGKTRGNFVAEVSPDPVATFLPLAGTGRERVLQGYPTGTKLWVRFAQVRYGLQSDWSTPVLVTIP